MRYMRSEHYLLLEKAIEYLLENAHKHPSLDEIAQQIGMSPAHFQRVFKEGVGLSPKRFLQATLLRSARHLLTHKNILETSLELGLSSPGRLYDLCLKCEALTPGQMRKKGEGLTLRYGEGTTPFGPARLILSQEGICGLDFLPDRRQKNGTTALYLQNKWPGAELQEAPQAIQDVLNKLFSNTQPHSWLLHLHGSNFQIQVWQAILRLPYGHWSHYSDIAAALGNPGASRAVGSAVAANPISYLIPCHRVLKRDGAFGHYAGGEVRKRILLAWEGLNPAASELPVSF